MESIMDNDVNEFNSKDGITADEQEKLLSEVSDLLASVKVKEANGDRFPLELLPAIAKNPDNFKLLTRIPYTRFGIGTKSIKLHEPGGDEKSMVILDTETTGLDPHTSKIIELAMVKVKYSPALGLVTSIEAVYDELEDPYEQLAPEVVRITGITNDDVAGKKIDEGAVCALLADNPLIVAHNAAFDRNMFEKRFAHLSSLCNLPWGCTLSEIKWSSLDDRISSVKQEAIASATGYFYDAHRASTDCLALLWLLNNVQGALTALLNSVDSLTYTIRALGAPFECRTALKNSGYAWYDSSRNRNQSPWWVSCDKYWYKTVRSAEDYQREIEFLTELYHPMITPENQGVFSMASSAYTRYK
ncbi:3'-5' exonuclease [Ruminobacter sp.]|uniref:3'-5' exonuclease n=1 Tax=Ruminobacter sp. TaxID=2774296 RepID=UPI00386A3426